MLIFEYGRLDALGARADHRAGPVAVESLGLARIDEADTFDGHLGAAVSGNEPWRRIKDEWVEEAIGLVVAGVALSVGGELFSGHAHQAIQW